MNTRRDFLKKLAMTSCATLLFKVDSFAVEENIAQKLDDDTNKALVFIMLEGGNDSINMLLDDKTDYEAIRPNVALSKDEKIEIETINKEKYSLHYKLSNIAKMFEDEELAFVANVGTMIKPINKESFESVEKPPYLYSHSTQKKHWYSMEPLKFIKTGWGGRIADMIPISPVLLDDESEEEITLTSSYGMGTDSLYLKGENTSPYIFDKTGVIEYKGLKQGASNTYANTKKEIFEKIDNETNLNSLIGLYKNLLSSSREKTYKIKSILDSSTIEVDVEEYSSLKKKLMLVANIINLRAKFGLSKQIFFIKTSGYDTHNEQKVSHDLLYADLDTSLNDFNNEVKNLGVYSDVLTFIGSDFGRTVTTNETGTDHGWGGHYFVFGEAVKGGEVYGIMPSLELGGSDLTSKHRLIPSTSVEEYLAPMCEWFGLKKENIEKIFPQYTYLTNKENENYTIKKLDFIKASYLN